TKLCKHCSTQSSVTLHLEFLPSTGATSMKSSYCGVCRIVRYVPSGQGCHHGCHASAWRHGVHKPRGVRSMKTLKWGMALTVAAVIAGGATSASAITFNLTSDHCTGGCGTPPFGTVDVTQSGTNVNITTTLAAGYTYAQTGGG